MFVKRFFEPSIAQASYLIGCARAGEAIVIDANRDLQPYLDTAEAEGLRITQVTETHIHADFVSGSRELAQRTGATLSLSDEGDADWKYRFLTTANSRTAIASPLATSRSMSSTRQDTRPNISPS